MGSKLKKKAKAKPEKKSRGAAPLCEIPATHGAFVARFPLLAEAHELTGRAVSQMGPLDRHTAELIKIGVCLGAGLESALKSHVRQALEHGASPDQIEHAVLLGLNTCGFPRTVAAWSWATELLPADE